MSELTKTGSDTLAKAIAKDVARLAGGIEKVLSKVLNQWFNMGDMVRHRREVTAKRLNYRIIRLANSLETNRLMCISVVECIGIKAGIFRRQFFKYSYVILDNLRVQT